MISFRTPDLTQHPPRSPRVRLGGLVILPRMLDKCRATLAGKNGEYHYNCPLDRRCLEFLGIKADALKKEVASGKSDGEVLEWIAKRSTGMPMPHQVEQWSNWQEQRVPVDIEGREFFNKIHRTAAPKRED